MTPTSLASTQRRPGSPQDPRHAGTAVLGDGAVLTGLGYAPVRAGFGLGVKYALDFVLTLVLLILAAPVFLILALAIKLTSPGPVFFVQERVGKDGRVFPFYKFRTMVPNADDSVHREYTRDFIINGKASGNGNGAKVYKLTRDPRVTRVGSLLRRTSLDELPQLFNILRGEMTLVGPRPPVLYELEHYQEWHKRRLAIRPGLTGLWQVSGRSSVPFDEMVLLDLYYIEHRSLWMDLRILLKTVPVMFTGNGGY